ncbi:hypothetical protein Adt_28246 [Abeliophyllum distichum]|uniref:Uncharacterized protein n=1 Tax=Abeliophyllum distichum TaxID=126358 RepID=A0ABD1RW09_9LAMI
MLTESPPVTIPSDTKATPMEDMLSITTMSEEQLPEILEYRPIVQIEESPTKEEEHVENEKLIINKQNEKVTFNDAEPINQFSDFHLSSKIDFVINAIGEVEIFIVEFERGDKIKSRFYEKDKVKYWRTNEKWCKVNRFKQNKSSKALFKVP